MPEVKDRGGVVWVDKPAGWSSQKTVTAVKGRLGVDKAGHAGTLDPMATGLLIVLIGKATKKFSEFQRSEKEYMAEIELGYETDTGDATGQVTERQVGEIEVKRDEVKKILEGMRGEMWQTPPKYSAVKVDGVAAYRRMRRGEDVQLKSKRVTIFAAELLKVRYPRVEVEFTVSSGTYIRSLVTELGRKLGTGATLVGLRRVRIGKVRVGEAADLNLIRWTDVRTID